MSAELVRRELDQLAHIAEQVEATQNELDELLAATQRPIMQLETLLAMLPSKEHEPVYLLDEQLCFPAAIYIATNTAEYVKIAAGKTGELRYTDRSIPAKPRCCYDASGVYQ